MLIRALLRAAVRSTLGKKSRLLGRCMWAVGLPFGSSCARALKHNQWANGKPERLDMPAIRRFYGVLHCAQSRGDTLFAILRLWIIWPSLLANLNVMSLICGMRPGSGIRISRCRAPHMDRKTPSEPTHPTTCGTSVQWMTLVFPCPLLATAT